MNELECEWCGYAVVEEGQTVRCDSRHPCPGCGVTWLVTWCWETEPALMDPQCPECGSDDLVESAWGKPACRCWWVGSEP